MTLSFDALSRLRVLCAPHPNLPHTRPMPPHPARRSVLAGTFATLAAPALAADPAHRRLAAIRSSVGGRLGLAALDTGSGRRLLFDADARYAMASTFKLPLAAAILHAVERGRLSPGQRVPVPAGPLPPHSPVVERLRAAGPVTVDALAAAIVEVSDNGAANLLLQLIGGPAGLTRFMAQAGDRISRLDRWEVALNENRPGDPRDTTAPAAMLGLTRRLLLDPVLTPASRARLIGWMEASTTGRDRLRAGLPPAWRAGDKTGTGARGAVNDLCIAWPPGRPPILIACYLDGSPRPTPELAAVHAEVGRAVAEAFA